jgi:hypothetical protein
MPNSNIRQRFIDFAELETWFARVRRPSGPVMEAERQFEDLVWSGDKEAPRLVAYDDLASAAYRGLHWIEVNPCPDETIGLHFMGQMAAYGDLAHTVRSAITTHGDGDVMVGRLTALRDEIDLHAEMIDQMEP